MSKKIVEVCLVIALFGLVGYTVLAQNSTTDGSVSVEEPSRKSVIQDEIQARMRSLRARQELIGQKTNNRVSLDIKVFLQGPYYVKKPLMNDDLRAGGYLSLTGPVLAGQQAPVLSASQLQVVGSSAIVDWVIVDLRILTIPTTSVDTIGIPVSSIVNSAPALLLRNGQIVGADGQPLKIKADDGIYFVSVRHRNHLGIMTAQSEYLSSQATSLDFTNGTTEAYGNNPQKNLNGVYLMRAGDANGNNQVSYRGANSDADAVLAAVGASTPNAIVEGYLPADLNLDGKVKYNGSVNDRNVVLSTVGLATPTNVVQGQIP